MGGPSLPIGANLGCRSFDDISGTMSNLTTDVEATNDTSPIKLDFSKGAEHIVQILKDTFALAGGKKSDDGNLTDLVSDKLPPQHDPYEPQTFGGGLKDGVCLRLSKVNIVPKLDALELHGDAKATLNIGTEVPMFDTPTAIDFDITSTSISPSQIGLIGSISTHKVFHADFKLQLHYDDRILIENLARFAKNRDLSQKEVEQILQSMSFDASAVMKLGSLPLSYLRASASSLLPLRRPLIGATDDLLPVQIAALPDAKLLMLGTQVVPKGVFFDTLVPGLGVHYSKYGVTDGFSGTVAGLAVPDLNNITNVKTYGYVDLRYAKRVSDALDIDVGITYTYSLNNSAASNDPLQLQYLHAESKSWLPPSQENQPPDANRSGHNFMFTVRGQFNAP
jgi:hypothetical protein